MMDNGNGGNNGNGLVNHVRRNWPIIAFTLVIAFGAGGIIAMVQANARNAESDDAKRARIEAVTKPIREHVDRVETVLESHRERPGHQDVLARVANLEILTREIRNDVKELLRRTGGS